MTILATGFISRTSTLTRSTSRSGVGRWHWFAGVLQSLCRSKLATRDEPSASAANYAKLSRSCFAGSMDPGAPT